MTISTLIKQRLKPVFALLVAITAMLSFSACSSSSSETFNDGIAEAKTAIERGDMDNAQKICDGLFNSKQHATAKQLASLSLLFMEISNSSDSDKQSDNIAAAAQCYIEAMELDADSAAAFYNSLSTASDLDRFATLHLIADGIIEPIDTDSIIETFFDEPMEIGEPDSL